MLKLRDTSKEFKLKGDLLEMITRKYYNVDLAGLSDKKFIYDFATETYFDVKAQGNKFTRVRTLMKLLKIPSLRIHASGISNTMFLSSDPKKLCNRLKSILQIKRAGNNFDKSNEEIIVILDKIIEYKCISMEQHKQIPIKCNLLHTEKRSVYSI